MFKDDIIYKGFEVARIAALNQQERVSYESSLKEYRDLYSVMKTAKQEGLDEGIAIGEVRGEARGEARGIEGVAMNMIAAGMSDQQISILTQLSVDAVAALRAV